MNGPQHYAEAERMLRLATDEGDPRSTSPLTTMTVALAQVHATLALVAATAEQLGSTSAGDQWRRGIGGPLS